MKRIKTNHKAKQLINTLSAIKGNIKAIKQKPNALLVTIDTPTPELAHQGIEITQTINGLTQRIYAARLSGCCIVWEE